ncbi:hypothetical protein ABKZ63_005205 [Salmonella enterica]
MKTETHTHDVTSADIRNGDTGLSGWKWRGIILPPHWHGSIPQIKHRSHSGESLPGIEAVVVRTGI